MNEPERIEAAVTAAQWLAGQGFGIVEAYAPTDGGCSCQAGVACAAPGKHPVGNEWQKHATRSPVEIERRVRQRAGQYGVIPWPGEGGLILDVDKPNELPVTLPESFRVLSRPGRGHAYFRLPTGFNPTALPASAGWGEVRVEGASRHVIGPYSRHASGTVYTPHGSTIAELPADLIAQLLPPRPTAAVQGGGYQLPDYGYTGCRYDAIRDYVASRYHHRLTEAELWAGVREVLAPRFAEPLPEAGPDSLRARFDRAWHGTPAKLGPPREILSAAPDVPGGRKHPLTFLTARELAAETPPETPWRVAGLLADGALTELDGRPKTAGKSTFGAALIAAVLDGRPFLGRQTVACPVVLLTEQPASSLRDTLSEAGLLDRADLHLLLWRDAISADWPSIVAAAGDECERTGARVLVVDTLPQFAGLRGESENDSGAALEAVKPLQAVAGRGLAVLLMRHDRKGGGDVGESARGSSAFTGSVDIVLRLSRQSDALRPTIRELAVLSRFHGWPEVEMIELTPEGYVSLGDEPAVEREAARSALLDGLPASGPGLSLDEIVPDLVRKRTTAQAAIRELTAEGLVIRVGKGRKGSPFAYRLTEQTFGPEIVSAAPMVAANRNSIPAATNGLTSEAVSIFRETIPPALPTDTTAMVPRPRTDA